MDIHDKQIMKTFCQLLSGQGTHCLIVISETQDFLLFPPELERIEEEGENENYYEILREY
jgi:hypothetical protein